MHENIDIVVVSLERAVERRKMISTQFVNLGRDWSFFDAHTSLVHPDLVYDDAEILHSFGRTLSVPERAVWSSHYSVIKRFLETSSAEYLLVLEDDVLLDVEFPIEKIAELCRKRNIDYIRLYGMYNADAVDLGYFYDRSIIRYKSSPAGTQAYLLSKAGAQKFTDSSRIIDCTVDLALDRFWRTGLPLFAVFPFPVIERFTPSSIPMQPEPVLSAIDRSVWTANRVFNRVHKMFDNLKLSRRDARFKEDALHFRQIGVEDMVSG